MSFGFSPTDIVTAIGACKWLIDHGFSKQRSADVRYRHFESAIRGLNFTLTELLGIIQNATIPDDLDEGGASTPGQTLLIQEARDLVGDFYSTVRECRRLLESNRQTFEWKNNFIVNIRYNSSMNSEVEELQGRLQAHSGKLNLVLEPLRMGILFRIEARIVDVQETLSPTPDLDANKIPPALRKRFEHSLDTGAPANFTDFDSLSRRDGLDVLHRQWRGSTILAQGEGRDVAQYVNLLKAHFLVMKLKASKPYMTAIRGYPYQRAILQMQKKIAYQYQRPELSVYVETELVSLSDEYFLFWDDPESQQATTAAPDDTFLEDTLLQIELPDDRRYSRNSLILKRTSPTNFRIISERVPVGSIAPNREYERVNMHSDRLIPWYCTTGKSPDVRYDIEIVNGNGAGRRLYVLGGTRDLFALQRALTGYQVASDTVQASWTVNEEKAKIWSHLSGNKVARLQLWLWNPPSDQDAFKPGTAASSVAPSDSGSVHTATGTNFSVTSTGTLAKIIEDCDESSFSVVDQTSPGGHERADAVIAAAALGLPVLMIYTKLQGRFTYLALELDNDIFIDPEKCHCMDAKSDCKKVVIRRRSNSSFRIRMLATDPNDIDTWDLSIFGRPAQFGLERHPLYHSDKVKKMSAKYLSLGFEHAQARARFSNHFKMAARHRDDQEKKVRKVYERFRSASSQLRDTAPPRRHNTAPSRDRSISSVIQPTAPRLPSVAIPNPLLRSETMGSFMDEKDSFTISTVSS